MGATGARGSGDATGAIPSSTHRLWEDPVARLWYARKAIEGGWSRPMLVHWVEGGLYRRQGKAHGPGSSRRAC